MTKQEVDSYFNENYEDIKLYISKSFSKNGIFNESVDMFLSEAYLYIYDRKEDIDTNKDLKNILSKFIYSNTYWTNSQVRESEVYSRKIKNVEYNAENFQNAIDEEIDLEFEKNINEYKAVVQMYYLQLTSLEKKAVWEIYFIENKKTVAEFSRYIKMKNEVGSQFIKELKEDLKAYYEEYKKTRS